MSEHSAENDAHAATLYRGRIVCTCGDFNCASLDAANGLRVTRKDFVRRSRVTLKCDRCGTTTITCDIPPAADQGGTDA